MQAARFGQGHRDYWRISDTTVDSAESAVRLKVVNARPVSENASGPDIDPIPGAGAARRRVASWELLGRKELLCGFERAVDLAVDQHPAGILSYGFPRTPTRRRGRVV
jgi:hypothetical protein